MKALFLFVFSFMTVNVSAQHSLVHSKGFQLSYHPYDLFAGAQYAARRNRVEHLALLQVGLIRTFFQQRIYPQAGYQLGYHLIDGKKLQAGLLLRPVISFLRVNKAARHGTSFYEEAFLGGFIGVGSRCRLRFSGGFGPCIEQKWSQPEARFTSWFSWNYFGEISWSHAF